MRLFAVDRRSAAPAKKVLTKLRGCPWPLQAGLVLGALGYSHASAAQFGRTPVCVPGTPLCASVDANGGVHVGASGQGQAGPGGANASGQANANANGGNSATEGSAGGPPRYYGYQGRFGVGVTGCPVVRIGVWSGFKAGGCVAVSFRFDALTFEMETQLLYGGTTHAFDWTFPMSFLIPLGNEDSLFDGGYLRFGGSPVGATFGKQQYGGNFVRFGLFAGAGYELAINDALSWRVIDARLSFDMATRRAMDLHGHWVDLGFQLSTGLVL